MTAKIMVLNGPNPNLLGTRQPGIYGTETLANIEAKTQARAAALGVAVDFRQSNSEGELVTWVQEGCADCAAIVINTAGYTHTSVAIMVALQTCDIPVIERHLSNIHRREEFRHHSYISQAATGIICGFGSHGYELAIEAAAQLVSSG